MTHSSLRWRAVLSLLAGALPGAVHAASPVGGAATSMPAAWTRPTPPFHVVGPIWYVGSEGLAAYLIRTRLGAILVDGTLAQNAALVRRNLAAIGVKPSTIRYILVSHAHFDHAGADAEFKAASGAKVVAGAGDRRALETGQGPGEYASGEPVAAFPPVSVDRAVRDGEQVSLGGMTLTARATPGHTPGCTTWTMPVIDQGRRREVAFLCSLTVAGNRLVGNRAYPAIAADYRKSFARVERMQADVILPGHPEMADVLGRHQRDAAGVNGAFIAPGLLQKLVADARADFAVQLAKQGGGVPPRTR